MPHSDHAGESWRELKAVLASVLEVDLDKRKKYVASLDIDDDLRHEIDEMLALEPHCADFLSAPAIELSGDFFENDGDPHPSHRQIGPYEIVGELGIGGMGSVYLAERRDGRFNQKVAIKMLRREFDTESIRRNFEREKAILAELVHPSIASLLDAGETDDGIPYLVMEYIDGLPVDKYCFENDLDLAARLKLFNRICDAVSFAHRNLIVHLDLKPSNILVTRDGVPKLLDFGISKILDADSGDNATTLQGAMTPEYASPEQINGHSVTTATDVYSLGIVLCKILTGTHPFKRERQSKVDLLRAITENEPTTPSLLITGDSQNNDATPVFQLSELRGDIDNIILRSIRKDPDRRYATVEQLSADIWRYIDGKPVEARPATRAYRLSKFYKRNRVAVTAGLLIFVTLVTGIAVSAWQTKAARANAAVAVAEFENARAEQLKAEKVSKFMMKIIRYANPHWYAEGHKFAGETRVIEALDDMATKIDKEFADHPDVLAELHHHFGDAYMARAEAGGREKAMFHFQRAFELRRSYHGDWHELLAKDMVYLYWIQELPRPEWAVQLLSNAIVMMRSTNPKNLNLPYMLEDYYHKLSNDEFAEFHDLYLRHVPQPAPNDKYLAADALFDEMLGLLRSHFPEDNAQIAGQKCAGMNLKLKVNKSEEAEQFFSACSKAVDTSISNGKPNAKWQRWLEGYKNLRVKTD